MFDSGISFLGDIVDLAVDNEVIAKQGAWLSYGDVRLGQGRSKAVDFLKENKDLTDQIKTAVLEKISNQP